MLSFDLVRPIAFAVWPFLVAVQSLGFVLSLSVARSLASGAMRTYSFAPAHGTVSAFAAMSRVVAAGGMMEAFGVEGPCGAVPAFGVLLPPAVARPQGFEVPGAVVRSFASDAVVRSFASVVVPQSFACDAVVRSFASAVVARSTASDVLPPSFASAVVLPSIESSDVVVRSIAPDVTESFEVMKSLVLVLAFGMLSLRVTQVLGVARPTGQMRQLDEEDPFGI